MCQKVSDYTKKIVSAFADANCTPDVIQTGNEISSGILFPYGKIKNGNTDNLFAILKAASDAIRTFSPNSRIMLHIDRGGDIEKSEWWFREAKNHQADFDIIGLSYYSFWHGTDLKVVGENIANLKKKFNKDVCIVETSYMWTTGWKDDKQNIVGDNAPTISDFPVSPKGQKSSLKALCKIVFENGGLGVFWWEPEAIASGNFKSDIENLAWFDFSGKWNGVGF